MNTSKWLYSDAIKSQVPVSKNEPTKSGDAEEVRRYLNEYWEALVSKLTDSDVNEQDRPVAYLGNMTDLPGKPGVMANGKEFVQVLQSQMKSMNQQPVFLYSPSKRHYTDNDHVDGKMGKTR
jgi:hypothetical protein